MYWGAGCLTATLASVPWLGKPLLTVPWGGDRRQPSCLPRGRLHPAGEDICSQPEAQGSAVACPRPHGDMVSRAICSVLSLVLWLLVKVASECPLPQGTFDGRSWGWELFTLDTGSAHP